MVHKGSIKFLNEKESEDNNSDTKDYEEKPKRNSRFGLKYKVKILQLEYILFYSSPFVL